MLFPQNDRIPIDWFKPTTCMTVLSPEERAKKIADDETWIETEWIDDDRPVHHVDRAALASLITAALQTPWIPITDRLPPADPMSGTNYHSIPVLIFWRESEPMICAGVYAFKRKRWFTIPNDEDDSHPVTHWMPRPDPPK